MSVNFVSKFNSTTSTDSTTTTVYSTIPVVAGRSYLVGLTHWDSLGAAADPTGITSDGGETVTKIGTGVGTTLHTTSWYFRAAATANIALTITWGGGDNVVDSAITVDEMYGEDRSTTTAFLGHSGYTADASGTTHTADVGATPATRSNTWGFIGANTNAANLAPSSGWTELVETAQTGAQLIAGSEFKRGSQTASWATNNCGTSQVAVEVVADLERGDIWNLVEGGDSTNKVPPTTTTWTFTFSATSGNLYMLGIRTQTSSGTAAIASVTCNNSQTVTNVLTRNLGSNAVLLNSAWYIVSSFTGTLTITITVSAVLTFAQAIWTVDEIPAAYFDAASPIVASNGADGTSTTPTLTFAAASHSRNIFWGSVASNVATLPELSVTSGMELGEALIESRVEGSQYQYPDVGTSMTWLGTSGSWVAIGAEIRAQQSPTRVYIPPTAVHQASNW